MVEDRYCSPTIMDRLAFRADGLTSLSEDDDWRAGCVAFIEAEGKVALVRKSTDDATDYDLAGLWAMPGGMIRRQSPGATREVEKAARSSLALRVEVEAGLKLPAAWNTPDLGPIVSRYLRRGRTRWTLLLARTFTIQSPVPLCPIDRTISEARWARVPPTWESIAPANRLALAHILWPRLSESEKAHAREWVEKARVECSGWAREVGLPLPPSPWASVQRRREWTATFI